MNLRISTGLPMIISTLAVMAVASAGLAAYEAFGRRQESEAFLKVNQISQLLLRSADQWALERGLTNVALNLPNALPAEGRAEIVKKREVADQAFREAVQRLRSVPAMKSVEKQIAEAKGTFQTFESSRSRVDETLAKSGTERTSEFVESFVPTITNLIEVAADTIVTCCYSICL